MREIKQALSLIAESTVSLGREFVPLIDSVGRRLARPIVADVDSPPHDKSLMDGFAVRSADVAEAGRRLQVVETILAGAVPQQSVRVGQAARIMTGAPLPPGADCIVMIENTHFEQALDETHVVIDVGGLPPGHHLLPRSATFKTGEPLFDVGHAVRPHDVGLLAEVGVWQVHVYRRPSVAVLATGDELVDCSEFPAIGQIRNSNGPLLESLATSIASEVQNLGVAPDRAGPLRAMIERGLESDVLILAGGVSAGMADLVPATLMDCGVREIFHGVAIKPGKPIWFGVRETSGRRQYVFGLPGNPVSTLVCFEVFVVGCCQLLSGGPGVERETIRGRIVCEHRVRGPRPTYWPVALAIDELGQQLVTPLPWQGSSDLKCLASANGLAILPSRDDAYIPGDIVSVLPLNRR